jgi:hypothetical protein
MMKRSYVLPALLILISGACSPTWAQAVSGLPHIIIYKTTIDYSNYVTVELTTNKKKIASYPAPGDVTPALKPERLHEGYWLSKMGVSRNTAILGFTVDDYRKLKHAPPSAAELYVVIKDKSPMTEIWDCGTRGALTTEQLNSLIDKMQLKKKCKKLK